MRRPPNTKHANKDWLMSALTRSATAIGLLLIMLAACAGEPEVVEVTRIVTETVVETIVTEEEPLEVEVTRVVTETVIETVEIEGEEAEEPPSATGSEGDAGPLPPPPNDGPKVAVRGGGTQAAEAAFDTIVTLRANQNNSATTTRPSVIAVASSLDEVERQKWCRLQEAVHKKRCR